MLHSYLCNVHVTVVNLGGLLGSSSNWMRPLLYYVDNCATVLLDFVCVKCLRTDH